MNQGETDISLRLLCRRVKAEILVILEGWDLKETATTSGHLARLRNMTDWRRVEVAN